MQPGDLVLVKSRGLVSAAGRRLAGNTYDHVAVVVRDGQTVNIDKPRSRLLPAARLLRPHLEPLVLRPAWPGDAARDAFVAWIEQLAGREYDVARTLRLLVTLVARRFLRARLPLRRPQPDQRRWICTDAVLLGLERHLASLAGLGLDWNELGCGTTNDFLRIRAARPDLLRQIAPGR